MNTASLGTIARRVADDRPSGSPPHAPSGIVLSIGICVALQLGVTIALPDQSFSMSLGMVGLCLICATFTWHLGKRSAQPDRFAVNAVSAIFILWAMMWLALIYEIRWRDSEQSLSCVLSFLRQIVLILFLVPRGPRFGAPWSVVLDTILGIVLCGVLTTTLWPHAPIGQLLPPDAFEFCLGHGIYAVLAVSSYVVQRRSPPMFLKALAIAQCIYSATSILSVQFVGYFGWTANSPLWVYGDTALIAYPLIARYTVRDQRPDPVHAESPLVPNQVVPLLIAILVLYLAFGSVQREQTVAALVGVIGLLVYAFRVAFVTRQYRQAQEALIVAGRMRVESLIDMVHELRSPLASVVLNASALARDEDIPARLKSRIDTIAVRCGAVTRLLNDVLDLERIEAGLVEMSTVAVDVPAVCREALEAVATTADAAGVALCGPGGDAQPFLAEGDASLLTRVVINLLDNAIRFTPAGGVVTVAIGHDGPSQIAVIVEDTGVGIASEARATLFKRFGHAADPVNGTKGSGLGLSISSSAIEAMHGQLALSARADGPGTRATIVLKQR